MKPEWERMEWWESQGPSTAWPDSVWLVLYEALDSEDWHFRSQLAAWLTRLYHPRLTQILVDALQDDEHANRRNTALQILTVQSRYIPDALRHLMESPHPDVRLFAVQLARTARNPDLGPDLQKRLNDPNPNVVTTAVESIGRLGLASAVPALRGLLDSEDPWVRYQTVQALGEIGHPDVLDLWPSFLQDPLLHLPALQTLGYFFDARAVALAVEALRRPDLAANVLQGTLRWFHVPWKDEWLGRYVRQFHEWLARAAPPADVLDALPWRDWLAHSSKEVARSAEFWAAVLQRPEFWETLPERLDDPFESERVSTVLPWLPPLTPTRWRSIWDRLESPEALHAWLYWQAPLFEDAAVRAAVLDRWDRLAPETRTFVLQAVLRQAPGPEVQVWLEFAWSLESPDLQDIIWTWLAQQSADPDRVAELLRWTAPWTEDPQTWRRAAAVDVRSALDPEEFRQRAVAWMQDPAPWVRLRVIEHATRADWSHLSRDVSDRLLRMALTDEHTAVRERAILAYPDEAPDLIDVLRATLAGSDLWGQAASVRRLAGSGHPGAFPVLEAHYAQAEFPLRLEILRHAGQLDIAEVLTFYHQEYDHRDLIHRRMILEGLAAMRRHAEAAFEFVRQRFDPHMEASLKVRSLMTMALLAPQRFHTWLTETAPPIEQWLAPPEWMTVLAHLDLPDVPEWARPWLYTEETWPQWIEICQTRPAWRVTLDRYGPNRLRQWAAFFIGPFGS
ncbi:MAG: HEAT repeat domain-containing protein [Acidobacteria bacterium]|nr:HEAT repeat domain-containing protein [Acidobacteriota bacterium]MDW7983434.1 HEAT repeat domain-containing protein [Acidobacteriota bacterium]